MRKKTAPVKRKRYLLCRNLLNPESYSTDCMEGVRIIINHTATPDGARTRGVIATCPDQASADFLINRLQQLDELLVDPVSGRFGVPGTYREAKRSDEQGC